MFLERVVIDVLKEYSDFEPQNIVFVVPNNRAIVFLKNYFAKNINKACVSAEFLSMSELTEQISGYKSLPKLTILFDFYEIYRKNTENCDDFEKFLGWGQTLLQDFNEIDQYLIEPTRIFPYIEAIKEVEHWSVSVEKTEMIENYMLFWNQLGNYYKAFSKKMEKDKKAYRGFIYRKAAENLDDFFRKNKQKLFIFAGFNALTASEEKIIKSFLTSVNSDIYWDIDQEFLRQNFHDAGYFISKYRKWNYYNSRPFKWISEDFLQKKQITITGVPKSVNQAHLASKMIKNTSDLKNSALILGDEDLLLPILQSIENEGIPMNITMGFPLKQTPMAELFNSLIKLYQSTKWYYKDVQNILLQPSLRILFSENYVKERLSLMQKHNWIYLGKNQLISEKEQDNELIDLIFLNENPSTNQILNTFLKLIFKIKSKLKENPEKNALELEYLYRFHQLFNELLSLEQKYSFLTSTKTLNLLYNDLLLKESLDFKGEPLQGLQIMGLLESQNLNFENIVITSVNEGVLPMAKNSFSFIPFDVRFHLGLPTFKERDAIFTYHFYRILQRAKNIHLIYNTENNSLIGKEKSRFLLQLSSIKNKNLTITEEILSPKISVGDSQDFSVEKDEKILKKLDEIAQNKGFSPTSLTSYILNPLDFYRKTILGIRDDEEVEEILNNRSFGKIIHEVLEDGYKNFVGQFLTKEKIEKLRKEAPINAEEKFKALYENDSYLEGKNTLILNVIQEYLDKFLTLEIETLKTTDIKIEALEQTIEGNIFVESLNKTINLNGTIDRIDFRRSKHNSKTKPFEEGFYIIDYKTGKVNYTDNKLNDKNWSELITDFKHSKAFQLLFYAYIIKKAPKYSDKSIYVGNYCFKNLKSGLIPFRNRPKKGDYAPSLIDNPILEEFEEKLSELLIEIFNQNIPFSERKP